MVGKKQSDTELACILFPKWNKRFESLMKKYDEADILDMEYVDLRWVDEMGEFSTCVVGEVYKRASAELYTSDDAADVRCLACHDFGLFFDSVLEGSWILKEYRRLRKEFIQHIKKKHKTFLPKIRAKVKK